MPQTRIPRFPLALFLAVAASAQNADVDAIRGLKCLTNDTLAAGAPFPAVLRAECNRGDSTYAAGDTALDADNFRVTYNPFGDRDALGGNATCVGACQGGRYERHPSPDQDFRNVRAREGARTFLDTGTQILGEDVIVHLPRGFNGPREHAAGLARGEGARDVVIMLHGGGGLGEAALSQLANLRSIQDAGPNGPVLLVPNAGNNLRMDSHQWAWDSWNGTCQTADTARIGMGSHVAFRAYDSQLVSDPYDDGFDDACAADLRRVLRLSQDLRAGNKWIRRIVLAGFSSGGHMTKTVMCAYPGAYDGYALFEHGDLIGTPAQDLCGNLDPAGPGYLGFVSRRIDSLIGAAPGDLAAAKRPLFQVCSDHDDACSGDLGDVWRLRNGVADTLITDRALERAAIDHTEINDARRAQVALARVPDSAALRTNGRGQYDWKLAGLAVRAQTTQGTALPASAASMVAAPATRAPACADAGAGVYDTRLCAFADANDGSNGQDDKAFLSVIDSSRAGARPADPPDEILAVRYVERQNGAAYGYIELHGGGHTVHGINLRADRGKTRDFDTFAELLKFMRYAHGDAVGIAPKAKARAPSRAIRPAFDGAIRFGDRNAQGRKF